MSDILSDSEEHGRAQEQNEPTVLTEAALRDFERKNMLNALRLANWRVSGPHGAASLLGVKSTTFADRMKKFGIARPRAARSTAG